MYNPQLETFIRVADAGSFNKAAEQTYITPTAVIKQINLQEDTAVLRIGTSPMTPAQILVELWPRIHSSCPEMKFQLVPFDNTPENAREILGNLGQNIDVVAGIFDDTMLNLRGCAAVEISREPICCAVSVHHRLADKNKLQVKDLYGENLMLMHRGWSHYVDRLRDDICENHNQISIIDFDFYNVDTFNRCENSNDILMATKTWESVHPLLKIIPVEWEHAVSFGLLHSPKPSKMVERFLSAASAVMP